MDRTPFEWMTEPLRRYAQFAGRARRAEFWWFFLLGIVANLVAAAIDSTLGLRMRGTAGRNRFGADPLAS